MPHDLPRWAAVYQQTMRWMKAGVFEAMVHDLCELLRLLAGRNAQPSAVILDSRRQRQQLPRQVGRMSQHPDVKAIDPTLGINLLQDASKRGGRWHQLRI